MSGPQSGPTKKGWCPSLFAPMEAGDGLLVRVKPRVAGVSAAQLLAIAAAAARYGSGRIEITNRGNFQIRGLNAGTVPLFADAMRDAGLASASPEAEKRRSILLALSDRPATLRIAAALERWLEDDAALAPLPAKFSFSVSDHRTAEAGPPADICLIVAGANRA